MKTSRRCKSTVLRPVALLCLGLIILNVTLWSLSPQLGHASASADTSASAGLWRALAKADASFSGSAEKFKLGTQWDGYGRAEAALGYGASSSPSDVSSGTILVKIKEITYQWGWPPLVISMSFNIAYTEDQTRSAWGYNMDKYCNASGNWEGSSLPYRGDRYTAPPPAGPLPIGSD